MQVSTELSVRHIYCVLVVDLTPDINNYEVMIIILNNILLKNTSTTVLHRTISVSYHSLKLIINFFVVVASTSQDVKLLFCLLALIKHPTVQHHLQYHWQDQKPLSIDHLSKRLFLGQAFNTIVQILGTLTS